MKKTAISKLIKDMILIAVLGGLAALLFFGDDSLSQGMKIFFWLAFTGLPFGWRWASKIISAVSLKGIAIKAGISALLGSIAIFVVVIGDVIHCFTAPSEVA